MAAITVEGRQDLVALYLTMFGTSPTVVQLATMVQARESGSTLAQVATTLSTEVGFALVASKDVDSFALYLADALLASDTPAEARDWGINWVITQLQGTMTKAQVIAEAVAALRATDNPMFATAQAEVLADVTVALDAIDNAPVEGLNFTLTTGVDTGSKFTGGSGNDTFVATDNNSTGGQTLSAGDSLNGGAGSDTLSIAASTGAAQSQISTKAVENLSVVNNFGAPYAVDGALMVGLEKVIVQGGNNTVTFNNLQNIVAGEIISANSNVTIGVTAPAIAGTADSATVTLNGVATTADVTLSYAGIETLSLVTASAASGNVANGFEVTVTDSSLRTLNVSGDKDINLIATLTAPLVTDTGVFDGSKATGKITASLTAPASNKISVTGGSGDDSFTVGALNKAMTVAGGDGKDTLAVSSATFDTGTGAVQPGANVSGFEVIKASASGTIDMRAVGTSSFTEATLGAGVTSVIDKAGSTLKKVTADVAVSGTTALTFNYTDAATATAAGKFTYALNSQPAGAAGAATFTLTSTTIDVLEVDSGGKAGTTNTLTATDAALKTVTITGDKSLTFTAGTGTAAITSVDASTFTGAALTVNASLSTGATTVKVGTGAPAASTDTSNTITTGSGADVITGGSYIDNITSGLGHDSITAGEGNDVVDAGGGNDTIVGGEGNNNLTGGTGDDSITAGAGNDLINAGAGNNTVVAGAGNDLIATTSLSDTSNIDGGAGTDRLAATTGTITATDTSSVNGAFITVADTSTPTLTDVETLYLSASTGTTFTSSAAPMTIDFTKAAKVATLFLEEFGGNANQYLKVKDFGGSTITLYGATDGVGTNEAKGLTIDGVGQNVTVNLEDYDSAGDAISFTGITGLTIAGKSTSQFTGSADQANTFIGINAAAVDSLTITTSGSAATNNAALSTGTVTATVASSLSFTSGTFDRLTLGAAQVVASGSNLTSLTLAAGSNGSIAIVGVNGGSAQLSTATITVADNGVLSSDGTTGGAAVDLDFTSVATLTATVNAGATGLLDLTGEAVTSGTFTSNTAGSLTIDDIATAGLTLGAASSASSFTFTGGGTIIFSDGTANDDTGTLTLVGSTVSFNASGMTKAIAGGGAAHAEKFSITQNSTAGGTITLAGGADTVVGGAGNDSIVGGSGNDSIQGGAGQDTLAGGVGTVDTLTYADVTAATSHSLTNLSGVAINLSASAVTAATIATAMGGTIVIGGGAAVAGADLAAGTAGYLATTAANSTATMVRDTVSGFERVIGSALGDYIAGSATADVIVDTAGIDYMTTGAGADTIAEVFATGLDTISDFTAGAAGDKVTFSLAALEAAGTSGINAATSDFFELDAAPVAIAAGAAVIAEIAADGAAGAIATVAAGSNIIVITGTAIANAAALETALEAGGDIELTIAAGSDIVGKAFIVAYSDGTDTYIASARVTTVTAADTNFEANDLTVTNLIKLTGTAYNAIAAAEFNAANFEWVA